MAVEQEKYLKQAAVRVLRNVPVLLAAARLDQLDVDEFRVSRPWILAIEGELGGVRRDAVAAEGMGQGRAVKLDVSK